MATTTKMTVSRVLASESIKALGADLNLTQEQLIRAKSNSLTLSSNPKLKDCDAYSIVRYCFEIARYNFARDDSSYPVPYGNKVQCQIGYKGFREIAMRSGKYNSITCETVYTCDIVRRNRETGEIIVDFCEDPSKIDRNKIVGFYAFAKDRSNKVTNSLYWSVNECEVHAHRYSKSYNSLWGDKSVYGNFEKMCKKTVIKRLCDGLSQTPELSSLIALDQAVMGKLGEPNKYEDNPKNTKAADMVIPDIPEDNAVVEVPEEDIKEVKSEE